MIIAGIDRKYISGIGKLDNRILIILELEEIFTYDEKDKLKDINLDV